MKSWILFVIVLCIVVSSQETDWKEWRGNDKTGITPEPIGNPKALINPKILWSTNVGEGFSAVTVYNGKLYTVGNKQKQDVIYCLNSVTGKEIWRYSYSCLAGSYPGPRATPTYENGYIYSVSREGHVIALNAETGSLHWQNNLQNEISPELPTWGFASSAYIKGDIIYLNIGEHGIALNKNTGKIIWKSNADVPAGYARPVSWEYNKTKYLVVFGAKALYFVDENTGNKKWSYNWLTSYGVNASEPIFWKNRMFISSGYGYGCASFDVSSFPPKLIWKNEEMRTHFNTCILLDGYLYGIDGQTHGGSANIKCIDFMTGKVEWQHPIGFSSFIVCKDKMLILTQKGELVVAEVNPKQYKEIARGKVITCSRNAVCWNEPVLSRGLAYCRDSSGQLVCVDLRVK